MWRARSVGLIVCALGCGTDGGGQPDASLPDGPPQVLFIDCDTVTQAGCPAGYKCSVYDRGVGRSSPACVPLTAFLPEGSYCQSGHTGLDDCGPGLVCGISSLTATTTCLRLCTAAGGCSEGQECFGAYAVGNGVCYPSGCDVFDPLSCDQGFTCDVRVTVGSTGL